MALAVFVPVCVYKYLGEQLIMAVVVEGGGGGWDL
jgi:hypothetical protein